MPDRDATGGRGDPPADREGRAADGEGSFLREYGRTVAIVVVVGVVAFAAFRGGDGQEDPSAPAPDDDTAPATVEPSEETAPTDPAVDESATTVTTLTPPDVAHERPEVDLAAPPTATDPVEVARWWAATYAVHVGSDEPADLAARLAPLTTERYRQTLAQVPPAASYDPPLELAGVTGNEVAGGTGTKVVRVSVETTVALVVYDVTLTEGPPGSWLVSESVRV